MCSINHDLKAIFIHIHKTGGTYISYILHKYYGFKNYYLRRPDHDTFCKNKKKTTKYLNYENRIHGVYNYYSTSSYLNKKMGMDQNKWNTYYKFCFIRNPYDKLISAWYHINRYNIPFKNYFNLSNTCNDVEYIHFFLPQSRNIIDSKNILKVNFIGKFENLEEDFQKVLKTIGIKNIIHDSNKKLNKRDHKPFYEYYDQQSLDKANIILKEDFYYLGFKKFTSIKEFMQEYNPNQYFLENTPNSELKENENEIKDEKEQEYINFLEIAPINNLEELMDKKKLKMEELEKLEKEKRLLLNELEKIIIDIKKLTNESENENEQKNKTENVFMEYFPITY